MLTRLLDPLARMGKKSLFLFGPRGSGKSFLLRHRFPKALTFDLLDSDVFGRFVRRPRQLGEEIPASAQGPIVIDEVQKIPALLDEVHRLIETRRLCFVLTGSSARKLRRGGANLLAGRARVAELLPLVSAEIPRLDFRRYLNYGGLPGVYLSDDPVADLRAYVSTYLREEIQAEAIVRRIDHFARFLDVVGAQSGEELVYDAIASDAGVPSRTVAGFVEVLKDTLVAFEVLPFEARRGRKAVSRSKLFLFDVGVANTLAGRLPIQERTESAGRALEHWVAQEIRAWLSYRDRPMEDLRFWRTHTGLEVDFVVSGSSAIEVKATSIVTDRHLKGLRAIREEGSFRRRSCVCLAGSRRQTDDGIEILPWRIFLEELWKDKIA